MCPSFITFSDNLQHHSSVSLQLSVPAISPLCSWSNIKALLTSSLPRQSLVPTTDILLHVMAVGSAHCTHFTHAMAMTSFWYIMLGYIFISLACVHCLFAGCKSTTAFGFWNIWWYLWLFTTAHKNFSLIIWPGTGNIKTCRQLVPWDLQKKVKLMNMDHYKYKIHEQVFFYSLKRMTVSHCQPRSTFCDVLITWININRINAGALRRLVQLDVQWTGTVHWQTCTMYRKMCAVQLTNKVVQYTEEVLLSTYKLVQYSHKMAQKQKKNCTLCWQIVQYLLS